MSLRQLHAEAERYAAFYFDVQERAAMLEENRRPVTGDYAVLVQNRFVPIEGLPDSTSMLRHFTRHGTHGMDPTRTAALKAYWSALDSTTKAVANAFEAGDATASVKAIAQGRNTWPAVAVADSEAEMRMLLVEQFEIINEADVLWRCVDSSTYPIPKPDGIFVLIDWFWHGY